MMKNRRPSRPACEWIIFWNEQATGPWIGCVPARSARADRTNGTVLKSFYGTESEAIDECRRMEHDRSICTGR